MTSLVPNQTVVKEGTFRYDAAIECDIRITHTPVRYGSGDYEDPTEIQNDVEQDIFYVEYGSITERGVFSSGGGGYPCLADAMAQAESVPDIGSTIRWKDDARNA